MPGLWIPYAVLLLHPQKGYIWTGEGSGKGHKDDQRCGVASQPGIAKQSRMETKWQSEGKTERHKSHMCVTGEASWAQWEHCPLQAEAGGMAWSKKVAGWKQGKGNSFSHNMLLSSASGYCGYKWLQKATRQMYKRKVRRAPLHFTDATSSSGVVWAPNHWLSREHTRQVQFTKHWALFFFYLDIHGF